MTDSIRLDTGDTAPEFALSNDRGETVSLKDSAGSRVIVYFYPRANTPGCTTEACDFTENFSQFDDAGVKVLGYGLSTTLAFDLGVYLAVLGLIVAAFSLLGPERSETEAGAEPDPTSPIADPAAEQTTGQTTEPTTAPTPAAAREETSR